MVTECSVIVKKVFDSKRLDGRFTIRISNAKFMKAFSDRVDIEILKDNKKMLLFKPSKTGKYKCQQKGTSVLIEETAVDLTSFIGCYSSMTEVNGVFYISCVAKTPLPKSNRDGCHIGTHKGSHVRTVVPTTINFSDDAYKLKYDELKSKVSTLETETSTELLKSIKNDNAPLTNFLSKLYKKICAINEA